MTTLRGWRYTAFIGVIIGGVGLTLYPIVFHPMLNTEEYRKVQQINRAGIKQEEIQPGNMKVWSDPFDRKKDRN